MLYFLNEYIVLVYDKVLGVRLRQKIAKLFDVECGAYLLKKLALLAKTSISNLNIALSQLGSHPPTCFIFQMSNTTLV